MLLGLLRRRSFTNMPRPSGPLLLLLVILGVAAALRLYGINWDSGYGFHPDERSFYLRAGCMYDVLVEAPGHWDCLWDHPQTQSGLPSISVLLDPERSPLNSHWFPLGSILIYALVFFRSVIELFADIELLDMRYVGRTLSALADVGTVFMVYVLGRRMFGQRVGLLGAALTALAVVHIQHSHFYRPETFSNLALLASFWAMLRVVEGRRVKDSLVLGLMVGLAMAPKVSVLPLVLPLALTYAYWLLDSAGGRWSGITLTTATRAVGHAGAAALVAIAVFVVSSPYALLDFRAFIGDLTAQANMARTAGFWPFTTQYIDTPAILYQVRQTTVWGLGIPLGIVAWASIPLSVWLAYRHPATRRWDLLLLVWVVPFFLFLESFEVKFLRYVFPLMPFMVLMAARVLFWLIDSANVAESRAAARAGSGSDSEDAEVPSRHYATGLKRWMEGLRMYRYWPALATALLVVVLVSTAFYALAHERIYARPHTAVAASQWFQESVPPGASIVMDNHWDEFVPGLHSYDVWQFPAYDHDSQGKMNILAGRLARADYLVFYSNRPYGSIARVPDRYPLSANYYRQLFAGELGYRLDRTFTSYPEFLGVSFKDDPYGRAEVPVPEPLEPPRRATLTLNLGYADENVIGYDHPQVMVFRNLERLPEARLAQLLSDPGKAPSSGPPVGLLLSEEQKEVQRSGGTWSDTFDRASWTNRMPVLAWLLVIEVIYLLALPLALYVFRPLPDRGIVLARVLGLLVVGYITWLLISLGWLSFSRATILLGFLVTGCLSGVVLLFHWGEILGFLRRQWRLLLLGEALFLVAFLAFVAIRAVNPDLWHPYRGGEKPMELAYMIAVARSTVLPPYDPWFAGGYLNYYYWGYFLLGLPLKLTKILPATAFNLAVPMFFALTFTGAYSLVYNLAAGVRSSRPGSRGSADDPNSPAADAGPESGSPEASPGGGAPTLGSRTGRSIRSPITAGLIAGLFVSVIGNLDGMVQLVQGVLRRLIGPDGVFPPFDYWRSSRMIDPSDGFDPSPLAFWVPDRVPTLPEESWHITEFPFFTFLFADLHAHMMVIPFTMLVMALGLSLLVGLNGAGRLWSAVTTVALALALGGLWVINSWDYPSYLLLGLVLLAAAFYFWQAPWKLKLALLGAAALGVVALSLTTFLPYHQAYETFDAGFAASKWRTPLERYLGIHGLFLFIIVTFLAFSLRASAKRVMRELLPAPVLGERTFLLLRPRPLRGVVISLGVLGSLYFLVAGYLTAAILLVLLLFTVLVGLNMLVAPTNERAKKFAIVPLLFLAHALLISIGVELVRLNGDIGRMNTLFKYYLEVWVLLSLVAAYMLWKLGCHVKLDWPWGCRKSVWVGILGALMVSSLVYTVLGTQARVGDRFNEAPPSLDGSAYMVRAVHWEEDQPLELRWDLEAIRWLQDTVSGSPVVLEAHSHQYRWNSRIANYTGLPTVLGWPWHQIQQRTDYDHEILRRAGVIRELYETTRVGRAVQLLGEHDVEYIVVGELERAYYSAAGLRKFDQMVGGDVLELVYENPGVKIYRTAP